MSLVNSLLTIIKQIAKKNRGSSIFEKKFPADISNTRQELAEYSGLSVKTVNRAVKKFEEQGLISRSGKTFYIDEGQYERLHALVSKLIEPLIERGRKDESDL